MPLFGFLPQVLHDVSFLNIILGLYNISLKISFKETDTGLDLGFTRLCVWTFFSFSTELFSVRSHCITFRAEILGGASDLTGAAQGSNFR